MVSLKRIVLALCVAAAAAGAQSNVVVPRGLGAKEGDTYSYTPAGRAPSRSQFIYAAGVMPGGSLKIKAIRFRRDGTYSSTYKAHTYLMEVWMANNEQDPAAGYTAAFAGNRGPDFTRVFDKKKVSYPAAGKPAQAPAPFSQTFTLDRPFDYQGKALLVEFLVHSSSLQSHIWYPDAESYSWTGRPSGGKREISGQGCPTNFYCYGAKPHIGQALYHYGYSRAGGQSLPALDFIGTSSGSFGPVQLPLALDALGAPGCTLYTSLTAMLPAATKVSSSTGYVRFDWGYLPNEPALVGAVYYEQQAVIDSSFNALGLRLSRLARCTIGAGYTGAVGCLHLSGYGSGFTTTQPLADKVEAKALVLELQQ